ncbi:MAG: TIGR03067 domain-containing protein, partial [Gemmataceae bacterium]
VTFAIAVTLATMALLVTGSYRIVERVTVSLVVLFTFMTVACVLMLPYTENSFSWGNLAEGFTFRIPESAIMAAFAMIGITGVGATELIMYPYWCIEKGYARNVGPNEETDSWLGRARGWLRVMYLDAWVSLVVYTLATIAFYFLGAAVLFEYTAGAGLPDTPEKMLDALAAMYAPVLGDAAANWFIVIGAFATLYSTLFAAVAAHSRTLTDFLRINNFVTLRDQKDRLFWIRVFALLLPVTGLILYLFMNNPVLMVAIGGIMQAVTLPMIAAAAVYLRYRRTDRRLLPGNLWDVLLWLSALVLFVVAGYGIWKQLTKADIEVVQGRWELVSSEADGAPMPSDELAGTKLNITLNRFRITRTSGEPTGGTFRLITGTEPRGIDVERNLGPDQGSLLGIYELSEDGKVFKVCLAPPGAPRPTDFTAPKGSGRILRVWKK